MNYLKLIRFPNLVVIALVQIVMRYCIVEPILEYNSIQLQFSTINFVFLVLAVVFMAAGGYIINDYFDTKADRFNQRKVIVGRKVSRRIAMTLHQIFTGISIVLSGYISYKIGHWQFVFIFFMAGGILWFYSTSYKYYFLLGTFLMAVLAAFIPFLVVVYEVPLLNQTYREVLLTSKTNFNYLLYWAGAFSFFAFWGALIAQFIRDLISLNGDSEIGRRSLAVVLGLKAAKAIIVTLLLLFCMAVFGIWYKFLNAPVDKITPWYFGFFIVLPLLLTAYKVIKYQVGEKFIFAGYLLRFAFLMGVCYAFVVDYILGKM